MHSAIPPQVKEVLRGVRRRLPASGARVLDRATGTTALPADSHPPRPVVADEPVRLLVAPANFAGQGDAWARCAREHLDGVASVSMMTDNKFAFSVDQEVPPDVYRDRAWQLSQREWALGTFTHALVEAVRPVFGPLYGPTAAGDVAQLTKHGVSVAMISHGSDIRVPSAHAARFPHSPFDDAEDRTTTILEARAKQNVGILEKFDGPVFVSTPDLLDYVPKATWCPVVIEPDRWVSQVPVLEREVPVVVHVPSSSRLKGSELVDPIMRELEAEGRIVYRSVRDLTHAELAEVYKDADIVLDQFVLGLYGVAAAEGMAAGRVVVAYVTDPVRERVREATGLDVPIVEADPDSVRETLLDLLADREKARTIAARGPEFVRSVHDGRMSAGVLSGFLGVPAPNA
ncbi:hypothetical protein N802_18760 [Knoellia sinensis KCTC 19936]|uniref:Glycosyl transferase family 1 domain-containing protein n=1 Tax=Knoellia sinensis KCTC 19936 TaxID=1385520 RepID=A0A0A0J5B2_9MICO|nr:hypothetical protein N802_18760 [Knoellia sinensis KCTC 19936]